MFGWYFNGLKIGKIAKIIEKVIRNQIDQAEKEIEFLEIMKKIKSDFWFTGYIRGILGDVLSGKELLTHDTNIEFYVEDIVKNIWGKNSTVQSTINSCLEYLEKHFDEKEKDKNFKIYMLGFYDGKEDGGHVINEDFESALLLKKYLIS